MNSVSILVVVADVNKKSQVRRPPGGDLLPIQWFATAVHA